MKITVLGSGTCAVTQRRSCASYFVQVANLAILVDIGFGALRRMAEAGIDYRHIDAVFCTHHHLDHVGDLAPFLMATRFTPDFKRQKRLTLIGPKNFRAFLYSCRDLFGDWLLPNGEYPLEIIELESEQFELDDCLIKALTMSHTPNTNGYRIEYKNRVLVFSGDTGPCSEIELLAKNADLAFFECSFPDSEQVDYHLTPGQAGAIAQKAGVEKVVLSHFYPMMDNLDVKSACANSFDGHIDVAEDFTVYHV